MYGYQGYQGYGEYDGFGATVAQNKAALACIKAQQQKLDRKLTAAEIQACGLNMGEAVVKALPKIQTYVAAKKQQQASSPGPLGIPLWGWVAGGVALAGVTYFVVLR